MRFLRRGTIAALCAVIVAALLIPFASGGGAAQGFSFSRYAGANRFDTARLIAVDTFGTSQTVLIATGVNFPDALAGSYVAGSTGSGAPILLVRPDSVPAETDAAINTLGATRATILGGPNAVSPTVEAQLRAKGMTVDRIQGATRYDTAKAAAERPGANNVGSVDGAKTAIIANGRNFPDALAGGPASYAGKLPTLLTEPDTLVTQARDALTSLGIRHVLLLGGPAALSTNVENQIRGMNIAVTRLQGATRQGTAVAIADFAKTKLGFVNTHIELARGDDFADALAMGPHGGKVKAPIVLTGNPTTLTTTTRDYLAANSGTLTSGHIAGGTAAVSDAVAQEATAAATGASRATLTMSATSAQQGGQVTGTITGSNIQRVVVDGCGLNNQAVTRDANGAFSLTIPSSQPAGECTLSFTTTFTDGTTEVDTARITVTARSAGFTVTPGGDATQTNGSTRSYTASGLGTDPVDLALFRCESVTTDSQGNTAFAQSPPSSGTAGQGTPSSTITTVNGAASPATSTGNGGTVINNVTPQNGQVTFTITGPSGATNQGECVVPVVFRDANTNNALDVNTSTGVPSETFGVGGRTTFTPAEAAAGAFNASDVRRTDKENNQFTACLTTGPGVGSNPTAEPIGACASYEYDSNDQFTVGGNSVGIATFEAALSPNDDISGTYTRDRGGQSQFNLVDEAPVAPANTTAGAGTGTAALAVQWDDSVTSSVDAYNIYRLQAASATTACPNPTDADALTTGETPARTYARVATVPDKSGTSAADGRYTYNDTGLAASTRYCYVVRAVDDGDESTNSDSDGVVPGTQPAQANTGSAPSNPGAPTITDARAQDGGLSGLLDQGDVHQLVFSEPMNASVSSAGSTYRLSDGDGTIVDIVCGTNAACFLQPAGTYNGTAYPANQVLRVNITATPAGAQLAQPGTTAGMQYPATITNVSTTTFRDADEGNTLNLAGSSDKTVDVAAITPAPNTAAPTLTSASASGSTLTTNWSEGVIGVTAAGFDVYGPADSTCAGAIVASGTAFVSDNGDQVLGVTLNTPLAPATYFTRVTAASVRDIDGTPNALTPCTSTVAT